MAFETQETPPGRGGLDEAVHERPEDSQNRLASATGNDDDIGMDRQPVAHGNQDAPFALALFAGGGEGNKRRMKSSTLRTDPFLEEFPPLE